jgi:hypothetical protein
VKTALQPVLGGINARFLAPVRVVTCLLLILSQQHLPGLHTGYDKSKGDRRQQQQPRGDVQ